MDSYECLRAYFQVECFEREPHSEAAVSFEKMVTFVTWPGKALASYQDALLSLSRERKRAGSPDDPQRGWLLQGTNA